MIKQTEEKNNSFSDVQNKDDIVSQIVKCWDRWNAVRQPQIDDYKKLAKEFYFNHSKKYTDEEDSWKSDVHLGKIFSLENALSSHIWESEYAQPAQMFDVKGNNPQSEETAKDQKAMLVQLFEKMDIVKELDLSNSDLLKKGETILFTGWKTKTRKVKRPPSGLWKLFSSGLVEQEITVYDGASVECIDPFNIVYDPNNVKNWDECTKIFKGFKSLEELKADKNYSITDEMIQKLNNNGTDEAEEAKTSEDLLDDVTFDGKFEVLELYGDFKVSGKLYKNAIAVVLNREYLIRFEENPFVINPFVRCVIFEDPKTGRGITLFKFIYDQCMAIEKMSNQTIDNQTLALNPPHHAPEEFYEKNVGDIKLFPGKIIKHKNNSLSNGSIIPVTLGQNVHGQAIYDIERVVSETSGIFPNMQGQSTSKDATATEIKVQAAGQQSRLSKIIDLISQNRTVKMVKNTAELMAMLKDGREELYVRDKDQLRQVIITNEVRQGDYEYTYDDKNALLQRKGMMQEIMPLFNQAAQNPALSGRINWVEVFISALELFGFDNTDKFLIPEQALPNNLEQPPNMQMQGGMMPEQDNMMPQASEMAV